MLFGDKGPLVIWPSLAAVIGLNEGIVFHQIHYWIGKSKHYADGEYWVYNSYKEWNKQFPFWSERTLRRVIKSLEDKGILKSRIDLNKSSFDKTKWYAIDYDILKGILAKEGVSFEEGIPKGHIENKESKDQGSKIIKGMASIEVQENKENIDIKMIGISDNGHGHNDQNESKNATVHRSNLDSSISESTHKTTKENSSSLLFKKSDVYKFYLENICPIPRSFDIEELGSMCKMFYENEVVVEAMKIAVRNNARKLSYIRRVLIDWEECGAKTLKDVQGIIAERSRKNEYSRNIRANKTKPKISGIKISKENHEEQDYSELGLI